MSALGQKQTLTTTPAMSAIPPKADIAGRQLDVRFVPKADIHQLFDSMVGARACEMVSEAEENWGPV
jgi:hypothetical protein